MPLREEAARVEPLLAPRDKARLARDPRPGPAQARGEVAVPQRGAAARADAVQGRAPIDAVAAGNGFGGLGGDGRHEAAVFAEEEGPLGGADEPAAVDGPNGDVAAVLLRVPDRAQPGAGGPEVLAEDRDHAPARLRHASASHLGERRERVHRDQAHVGEMPADRVARRPRPVRSTTTTSAGNAPS